jgi:ankyrin repeat protein
MIRLLIENGVDVNQQDKPGGLRLQVASKAVVATATAKEADVKVHGGTYSTFLQIAAAAIIRLPMWHARVAGSLLQKHAHAKAGDSALHLASQRGDSEVVRLLIGNGANVNAWGGRYWTSLYAASVFGHQEVVLSSNGAHANARGPDGTALQVALISGYEEVVRMLLANGADINARGHSFGTVLYEASLTGNQKMVHFLLEKGADINMVGGKYGTALQAAAAHGHEGVVRLLFASGANVNARSGKFDTALKAASLGGHKRVTQFL